MRHSAPGPEVRSEVARAAWSEVRRWGFILLALACSALSYADRQVISLIVEPLKQALKIGDAQVGLLQGLAFSLCYALAGLPLALAIDRGRRASIASACVAAWSLATGGCGLVSAYLPFLLARAATAVSEAGFSPAVLSMIADVFPRNRVPRATAVYLIGPSVGTGAALVIGGALLGHFGRTAGLDLPVVGHLAPWQAMFAALLVPGLILAILFAALVEEPVRLQTTGPAPAARSAATRRSILAEMAIHGGFLIPYMFGIALVMTSTFALGAWAPSFFVRDLGLAPPEVGKRLGPIFIATSLLGALISGALSGRSREGDVLGRVLAIIIVAAACIAPALAAMTLAHEPGLALVFYALTGLASGVATSLATTPFQLTVANEVRAQTIVLGGFLLAVIGAGLGPWLVGVLDDQMFRDPRAVGRSLAMVSVAGVVMGLALLLLARRNAKRVLSPTPEAP